MTVMEIRVARLQYRKKHGAYPLEVRMHSATMALFLESMTKAEVGLLWPDESGLRIADMDLRGDPAILFNQFNML